MQVVHEVHRQGCELQNQLHIVHVGCLVLPVPTVVHVPEVDHIPASVKIRSRNVERGGHMHTHNTHMFVVRSHLCLDNTNEVEAITMHAHTYIPNEGVDSPH